MRFQNPTGLLEKYFLFLHGQLCISPRKTHKLLSKYSIKREMVVTQEYIKVKKGPYILGMKIFTKIILIPEKYLCIPPVYQTVSEN